MSTLLERVRAATGPDRRLEADVVEFAYGDKEAETHENHDLAMHRYLSSVDAALTLADRMLPDCQLALYTNDPACLVMRGDEPVLAEEHAATLPLAIVAAALVAVGNNEPPER